MAEGRRYGIGSRLDIEQILLEAQHRWLRPAEVCEILRNYHKFQIAPEPPNKPPSGSLFLFDRKVLRYFRKDGHNWRKKKDGKTVREAHERLKAGSVDVLHCYYAHGEENENFQRRSYWMLEEDFEHIVLVHYREVKGSKTSFVRANDSQRISANVEMSSPACSSSHPSVQSPLSTNTSGLSASHALEYEEVESCGPQVTSRYQSQFEMQPSEDRFFLVQNVPGILQGQMNYSLNGKGDHQQKRFDILQSSFMSAVNYQQKQIDLSSWEAVLKQCTPGFQVSSNEHADGSGHSFGIEGTSSRDDKSLVELTEGQSAATTWPISAQLHKDFHEATALDGQKGQRGDVEVYLKEQCLLSEDKFQKQHKDSENTSNTETALIKKEPDCLAEGEGLKKLDSFCRWMSKEFGDVDESLAPPKLGLDWYVEENTDMGVDADLLSPSISQEQLFSIDDFSPNWLYAGVKSKVLVTGTFLNNHRSLCKWSCMFGEVEVPAEVIAPGVLRCFAPRHEVGRVPFYVTCSNRLACSEVREFEFRANKLGAQTSEGFIDKINETRLQVQLAQMLSLGAGLQLQHAEVDAEHLSMCNKIRSLLKDDEDEYFQGNVYMTDISGQVQDKLLQQLMKGKLLDWLLVKAIEDGKGPNVLDKEGQGVLHLACALGYDWAIAPMLAAGVNINFRDVHGWTALHWAAFCGRERTVVALVTMGGAPGALTDPTPHFPSGQTPADLASTNGHKGIAGYLAESSLTSHLSTLTLKETLKDGRGPANSSETAVLWDGSIKDLGEGDTENGSSLKDSLAAVRTATQAAARIHQVFRLQSFQRKQLIKHGDDGCGILEEHALSRLSGHKAQRVGHHDEPVHFAAIKIQKKFRGWKGRKEFLIIRQRIVKIQAHVRGHQVRKHLRKIVWTVGIVEKAILRWRRKGIGLRGFRSDGLIDGPAIQSDPSKSDDDDFLREGRRQTEARLDKALARVKSMVQYPDARDQYRRLLNVVTEFEDSKVEFEKVLSEAEAIEIDDVVIFETEEEDGISMFTSV